MSPEEVFATMPTIDKVWLEVHDEGDVCDVIVQLEDQSIHTALFVTLDYLHRQMALNHELSRQVDDTVAVRFTVLDTPHILVENLNRDTIEDTLDNLLVMETFESLFTRVTEHEADQQEDEPTTTHTSGQRATQEVAAVVLTEVLVVEE